MDLPSLLLVRPGDHVVVGVAWSGYAVAQEPPRLMPQSGDPRIALTFPPQAIGEEKFEHGYLQTLPAGALPRLLHSELSGPSRIEFRPGPGREIPLTVAGLLAALSDPETTIDTHPLDADGGTWIELPWRLISTVEASGPVVAENPDEPIVSPASAMGLWRTRLRAEGASGASAELLLKPFAAIPGDDPTGFAPLSAGDRGSIISASAGGDLPDLSQIELSALGGTLAVKHVWQGFEWQHHTSLGRDMDVRVVSTGVLYPFGHRAQVVEVAQRKFDTAGAAPGVAVAGLESEFSLIILDPTVGRPGDERVARQLPFQLVKVLATQFALAEPQWETFEFKLIDGFLDELVGRSNDIASEVDEFLGSLPGTLTEYQDTRLDLQAARGDVQAISDEIAGLQAGLDEMLAEGPRTTEPPVVMIEEPPIGSSPIIIKSS